MIAVTGRGLLRWAVGSAAWIGTCFGLLAVYSVLPRGTPTLLALSPLGGMGLATYALGYYVRNWWAVVVPVGSFVVITVEFAVAAVHGEASGTAILLWVLAAVFAGVVALIKAGMDRAERRVRAARPPVKAPLQ